MSGVQISLGLYYKDVAQLVEHWSPKPDVEGSSPSIHEFLESWSSGLRHRTANAEEINVSQRFKSSTLRLIYARMAQLEDAIVLDTIFCRFNSCSGYFFMIHNIKTYYDYNNEFLCSCGGIGIRTGLKIQRE